MDPSFLHWAKLVARGFHVISVWGWRCSSQFGAHFTCCTCMMQDPVFRRPFGPDKLLPTPASAGDRFLQVQLNINMKWWKLPNPSFLSLRYGKLVPTTSRLISRAELASQPLSGRRAGSWRYSLQDSEGGGGRGETQRNITPRGRCQRSR